MLPSILIYGGTCLPNTIYSDTLARAAVPYQAFRYRITCLSRWHSEKALRRNRLLVEAFRYSIDCVGVVLCCVVSPGGFPTFSFLLTGQYDQNDTLCLSCVRHFFSRYSTAVHLAVARCVAIYDEG